jgi:hypothetical protein
VSAQPKPQLAVELSEQQELTLKMFHWLEVVGTTERGGVIVQHTDGDLSVIGVSGLFERYP